MSHPELKRTFFFTKKLVVCSDAVAAHHQFFCKGWGFAAISFSFAPVSRFQKFGMTHAAILNSLPCSDVPSGSSARESEGLFPQPLHVAHGWDAEEAFVLAIEVGGVVVAHTIGGTGRVEVFAQH